MAKRAAFLPLLLFAAGCGKDSSKQLATLSEEFVYGSLAFSPSAAMGAGLHEYQGQKLDEMLDDTSPGALAKQRRFYEKFRDDLAALNSEKLAPEERADLLIMQDQISLSL